MALGIFRDPIPILKFRQKPIRGKLRIFAFEAFIKADSSFFFKIDTVDAIVEAIFDNFKGLKNLSTNRLMYYIKILLKKQRKD